MSIDALAPRSRRHLLAAAVGGLAAVAATVVRPLQAVAATQTLSLVNDETNANVLQAFSGQAGIAVRAESVGSYGVMGLSDQGTAILGSAVSSYGVRGSSADFVGVRGDSENGRGGVFQGRKAQARLIPSGASTHPASGSAGDLFVDRSKRLWFCKGGTTWVRLA